MSKGYWLATYKKIESKDNLGNYAKKATETIKSYGGNPLVRGGKYKCLEGNDFPRTVIWEFPSYEAAETQLASFQDSLSAAAATHLASFAAASLVFFNLS